MTSDKSGARKRPNYQAAIESVIDVLVQEHVSEDEAERAKTRLRAEDSRFRKMLGDVLVDNGLIVRDDRGQPFTSTPAGMRLALEILADRHFGLPPSETWLSRVSRYAAELLLRLRDAALQQEQDAQREQLIHLLRNLTDANATDAQMLEALGERGLDEEAAHTLIREVVDDTPVDQPTGAQASEPDAKQLAAEAS